MDEAMLPDWKALTLKEAANLLQVSYGAIFQAVHRGEIPAFRIGMGTAS